MLVIGAKLKSKKKFNDYKDLKNAAEACRISRWRLPGTKFGLMTRMTSDQLEKLNVS